MAWLVALVLAILTKRAAAAPSVRPVTPTAQAPARYRQAGVRPDFGTIPATWASDLPARHPPWQASPAALLGVARGERVPIVPAYEGP